MQHTAGTTSTTVMLKFNMKTHQGFVVGKFVPFHKGHRFLIDTALAECDRVFVLSYTDNNHGFNCVERKKSIMQNFLTEVASGRLVIVSLDPNKTTYDTDDILEDIPNDDASEYEHRLFCATILKKRNFFPDRVFTSETYGDGLAGFLSGFFNKIVTHSCVDLDRVNFPVSATKIRNGQLDAKEWSLM